VDPRLDRILKLVREHVPDLRLVDKHDVRWMRWLGGALRPVVPEFSTRYTTVLGPTVFLPQPPADMVPDVLAATLAHELVHQIDQRRWGLLFYVSYGFCLPAVRSMRAWWERRAYAVDLLIARERGGPREVERVADLLVELFAGRAYLWMWAGRRGARRFLDPVVHQVVDGDLDRQEPYRSILAAWRGERVENAA
jgi:hypothetical protein